MDTAAAGIHGMVIQFQDLSVFFCPLYQCLVVHFISSVIRMTDDIDAWILHGVQIRFRVLLTTSRFHARGMQAGDDDIQLFHSLLRKIYGSFRIQNIDLRPQHQLDAVQFSRHDPQIVKIKQMTGSRHLRCMFRDSQQLQPFIGGCFCHLS